MISTAATKSSFQEKVLPWIICLTGGLLFFYEFIQLNLMNTLNPFLSQTFHLSPTQISTISAMYFVSNAALVFVAGNLLDRYSNKSCILFATFTCTIGTLGFAWAQTAWQLAALRFIIGIGGAFCFISAFRLATRWFPVKKLAFITGIIVTIAMCGGLLAQQPAMLLIHATSWRTAMLINGGIGIFIMFLMVVIIKDSPNPSLMRQEQSAVKSRGLMKQIIPCLKNKKIWGVALYGSLLNLAVFMIGALWGTRYLMREYGLSSEASSYICSMIYLGSMFGCPLVGYMSDRFLSQKKIMIAFSVASLFILASIIYLKLSYIMLVGTFFAFGLFTSSQVLAYPYAAAQASASLKATSASIVSTCMELLPAIFQPIFGFLLTMHSHARSSLTLSTADYRFALNILVIAFILSIILSFILPKQSNQQESH